MAGRGGGKQKQSTSKHMENVRRPHRYVFYFHPISPECRFFSPSHLSHPFLHIDLRPPLPTQQLGNTSPHPIVSKFGPKEENYLRSKEGHARTTKDEERKQKRYTVAMLFTGRPFMGRTLKNKIKKQNRVHFLTTQYGTALYIPKFEPGFRKIWQAQRFILRL